VLNEGGKKERLIGGVPRSRGGAHSKKTILSNPVLNYCWEKSSYWGNKTRRWRKGGTSLPLRTEKGLRATVEEKVRKSGSQRINVTRGGENDKPILRESPSWEEENLLGEGG